MHEPLEEVSSKTGSLVNAARRYRASGEGLVLALRVQVLQTEGNYESELPFLAKGDSMSSLSGDSWTPHALLLFE